MTLYLVHRTVLREEMRCRRARIQDREAIEKLLFAVPTRREILTDFDFAMDSLRLDLLLDCFIFESNDMMLGLAILWLLHIFRCSFSHDERYQMSQVNKNFSLYFPRYSTDCEKQINFVTSHYHVEDYVSVQSIPRNCGRLLHFVLMPIFSAYHRFFFREIARLSELTVIFYRLHHEDESTVSYTQ